MSKKFKRTRITEARLDVFLPKKLKLKFVGKCNAEGKQVSEAVRELIRNHVGTI